jgi:two-component system sensor histidine kinase YesM
MLFHIKGVCTMTSGLSRLSWNSIRFKLVIGVLLITLPTIGFLIYNNLYAISVVRNQAAEANRNLISLYMGQIDNNLNDVDEYLTKLIVSDKDLETMGYTKSEKERSFAKVRLDNKIKVDIGMFKSVDAIFVYSIPGQDYFEEFLFMGSLEEREEVRGYLQGVLNELQNTGEFKFQKWFVREIGQTYYLFRVLQTSDAYVGAWVRIENLSVPLSLLHLGENGYSLFATDSGVPMTHLEAMYGNNIDLNPELSHYYLSGGKNKYLVVGEKSAKGNFSLFALIPDDQILENLPYLRRIVTVISVVAIILVPACLLILRKMVLGPLNRIMSVMRRIGEGNMNTRIEPYRTSDEFRMVNDTFNKMIEQIRELRIHVYEEQLSKQEAELQHLQLQIKPHFFMNSLNIIYNLALVKNFDLIQEMAFSLVQYFRYMFSSNLTFVPLRDELKHIRNYIRIQELRFPGKLTFEKAPEFLEDTRIPPLVIQTFVENSIKHAVTLNDPIHIAILIDLDDSGSEPRLSIAVRDTGKGFNEEILMEIRAGNRILDDQGEHIGIWNVQRRLCLLYGEHAQISFNNANPSGAMVEMLLPLHPEQQ